MRLGCRRTHGNNRRLLLQSQLGADPRVRTELAHIHIFFDTRVFSYSLFRTIKPLIGNGFRHYLPTRPHERQMSGMLIIRQQDRRDPQQISSHDLRAGPVRNSQ